MGQRYAEVVAHHVHLATEQIGERGRRALVGNVCDLQPAGALLEKLGREVRSRAVALRSVVQLAGIRLGIGNQLLDAVGRHLGMH